MAESEKAVWKCPNCWPTYQQEEKVRTAIASATIANCSPTYQKEEKNEQSDQTKLHEEAVSCLAPIAQYGYKVLRLADDGRLKCHIHCPAPLRPRIVLIDELPKFVDEVLKQNSGKGDKKISTRDVRKFALLCNDDRENLNQLLGMLEQLGYSHDGKSWFTNVYTTLYKEPSKDKVGKFKDIGELKEWVKTNLS